MPSLNQNDPRLFDLQTKLGFLKGEFYFKPNLQNYIDVRPMGLEEFMRKWWLA